uniref:Histidine kinase n=1 Tax=Amphora coffeiformis TaxID=265554 RepID=A0A7S3P773_9STRA
MPRRLTCIRFGEIIWAPIFTTKKMWACSFDASITRRKSNPSLAITVTNQTVIMMGKYSTRLNRTNNNNNNKAKNNKMESSNCFVRRFIDRDLGKQVFQKVVDTGEDCCFEAQQHSTRGPCWCSIKVRRTLDPVSEEPVMLYSARDISEVIKAKSEADQANMEKSEMLAVLSHEIRTPLHQVVGFIELLADEASSSSSPAAALETTTTKSTPMEQKDILRLLQTSTVSLMTIINDVLDYTKLEAGKMVMESIPFDLNAVCHGCLEVVAPIAERKGLCVTSHCVSHRHDDCGSGSGVMVMGDPNRVRQVILNLLSNAVKFTTAGSVALSWSLAKGPPERDNNGNVDKNSSNNNSHDDDKYLARVTVRDTGIGICSEQMTAIFKKYQQSDATIARQYGGTGLGLAICKTLAEAMGGRLEVQSQLGKGSEFCFEIPVTLAAMTTSAAPTTGGATVVDTTVVPGMNILVAEDNEMNQKLVKAMLKRSGHVPTIVGNGQEAIDEIFAHPNRGFYDLVLMDVQMPVLGGIEATEMIRNQGWNKEELPIIGLTASFQKTDLDYYLGVGMNDCLGKPVRMNALQDIVKKFSRHNAPAESNETNESS